MKKDKELDPLRHLEGCGLTCADSPFFRIAHAKRFLAR
jgi:hypothetical protein